MSAMIFPRAYLKAVEEGVGDWAVYFEPVKAGPRGYFAVGADRRCHPKPGADGLYLALIAPGSYLPFDAEVPRLLDGGPGIGADQRPRGRKVGRAGATAVRRLPEAEFAAIVRRGLPVDLEAQEAQRYASDWTRRS